MVGILSNILVVQPSPLPPSYSGKIVYEFKMLGNCMSKGKMKAKLLLEEGMQMMINTCEATRDREQQQVLITLQKNSSNVTDLFDKVFCHDDTTGNLAHSVCMPLEIQLNTH